MNKEEIVKKALEKLENKEDVSKEDIVKAVSESLEKAVTSDAAPAENGPENEAELNGESKPKLQDAKSPQDLQEEQKVEKQEVPDAIDASQAEGGKEISMDDLFGKEPYVIGSTLKQEASGNVITNIKQPKMDYVDRAKNHKNQTLNDEDFSKE